MKSIFLSSILHETRRLWNATRMWYTKGKVAHEESNEHKENVDHGVIEDQLNEI